MKPTQLQIVKEQVDMHGEISRNWCLNNFISRLGAIVPLLNKMGYDLRGRYVPTEQGKDFIYYNRKLKQENLL